MDVTLNKLFLEALSNGLEQCDIENAINKRRILVPKYSKNPRRSIYIGTVLVLIAFLFGAQLPKNEHSSPWQYATEIFKSYIFSWDSSCLIGFSGMTIEIVRPLEDCSFCKDLKEVPIVYNITKEYFLKHHAYTGVPVLVKQGTGNWTALRIFGWRYFRVLYAKLKAFKDNEDLGCQFFPYKTEFKSLKQVLFMSKERANLTEDQWYIGWSNCVPRVQEILRHHYQRPSFLPDDSESSALDWVFMGGSGTGALMHIDYVNRPSWQAQVKGKKTWYIEPPPECESVCPMHLQATMEPSDIIVIDTNKWFHSTFIHPGNISITIGSEYD
ncbi:uncharacterized protein LOC100211992 isoform X1 [Hydra vulgaris]|uniref:uncharacterized protein LOC100211992 isoform X1 n=1 Tax=Hydra vulgaris TaxID=6087 RepID=UPI0001926DBF|nr:uncharacterized protein LOC100211992 [Hydra vulgaris]